MRRLVWVAFSALGVTGCSLPPTSIGVDELPPFQSVNIVSSQGGQYGANIATIPGRICLPDNTGRCSVFWPQQALVQNAKVAIKASESAAPQYHSLISGTYNASADVPFVKQTGKADTYDEIKAGVIAYALIEDNTGANGFPGVEKLKSIVTANNGATTGKYVYWIESAEIIGVLRNRYTKVSSTLNVSTTGVGIGGDTYNGSQTDNQEVWIGVVADCFPLDTTAQCPTPPAAPPIQPPQGAPRPAQARVAAVAPLPVQASGRRLPSPVRYHFLQSANVRFATP